MIQFYNFKKFININKIKNIKQITLGIIKTKKYLKKKYFLI